MVMQLVLKVWDWQDGLTHRLGCLSLGHPNLDHPNLGRLNLGRLNLDRPSLGHLPQERVSSMYQQFLLW